MLNLKSMCDPTRCQTQIAVLEAGRSVRTSREIVGLNVRYILFSVDRNCVSLFSIMFLN